MDQERRRHDDRQQGSKDDRSRHTLVRTGGLDGPGVLLPIY
jgi:hypothetical protein